MGYSKGYIDKIYQTIKNSPYGSSISKSITDENTIYVGDYILTYESDVSISDPNKVDIVTIENILDNNKKIFY